VVDGRVTPSEETRSQAVVEGGKDRKK